MSKKANMTNSYLNNAEGKKVLAILKPNQAWLKFGALIIIIIWFYSIFGVIIPVLKTGGYATMLVSSSIGVEYRIAIFYTALIVVMPGSLFLIILTLRTAGTYYFYNDRIELHTYWIKRKVVIPYNEMHVIRRENGLIITKEKLPDWSHPLKRLKMQFWDGVGFGTNFTETKVAGINTGLTKSWTNPEDGTKILTILKEKAYSFVEIKGTPII